jgi:hypothetical protein
MREFKPIFLDRADRSLRHLLDAEKLRELPDAHLSGSLLIVPAPADAPMQEEYVLRAARSLGPTLLQTL